MKRPRRWAIILGAWTAFGLLSSAQQVVGSALAGRPMPWWMALELQFSLCMAWAAATPGILWLGKRFPFYGNRWRVGVLVHLVTSLTFIFLLDLVHVWHNSLLVPQIAVISGSPTVLSAAFRVFLVWVLTDGLLYWTVLSAGYAVEHYSRYRERELAASQLETQLVQADLRALKMQLHPHFLFNALHTIAALVRTGDPRNAIRVTVGLGSLLRRMLDEAREQEVPLGQELDFIRSYLEIEQLRFPDRLVMAIEADPELLEVPVPQFILQPLVENAIRHGIAPHRAAGTVTITARAENSHLRITVRDDGKGLADAGSVRYGVGLSNTQARLTALYEREGTLRLSNVPGGGLEATVELPLAVMAREALVAG